MLSARSNMCLRDEIEFLRQDLNRLYLELGLHYGVQPFYPSVYGSTVANMIERKKTLFKWKKTRLEALETFAHAQLVIADMEYPVQFGNNFARTHNKPRRWKRRQRQPGDKALPAICASADPPPAPAHSLTQNYANNQRLASKPAAQTGTDALSVKTENDSKENIAQSIAETLNKLKKEKVDPDENGGSVMDSNINAKFVPQLLAGVKVEHVCSVKNEGRKRKGKRAAERERAKRARTESPQPSLASSSAAAPSPAADCP